MPDRDTYRDRALEVRRDAQARLRELRQARMARRAPSEDKLSFSMLRRRPEGGAQGQPAATAQANGASGDPGASPTPPSVSSASVLTEDVAATAAQSAVETTPEPPAPEPAAAAAVPAAAATGAASPRPEGDVQGVDTVPDAPSAEPQVNEPVPDPSATSTAAPAADAAVEVRSATTVEAPDEPSPSEPELEPEMDAEADEALKASDLNCLPGAGIGLVWLLRKCGIEDMAALARSNPEELAEKLGNVGQLISLQKWIDHAKAEAGRRRRR